MPDYKTLLRSIGLNESEVAVYLTNLEIGPAQAQNLVKRSGFSRPATYLAIEQLTKKGLLSSVLRGKRHLYAAEPPERLLNYGRARLDNMATKLGEIEGVLEDLRMLQKGERPSVKFFEGALGLRSILQDLVNSKPESIDEIVNIDALRKVFGGKELEAAQNVLDRVKAKGRALFAGHVSAVRKNVEARILPKEFQFAGDIMIYNDKIAMVSYKDRIMGTVIQNAVLADTYRALFELAWRGAREFPKFGY